VVVDEEEKEKESESGGIYIRERRGAEHLVEAAWFLCNRQRLSLSQHHQNHRVF
jgi:hypothetical protein